MAKNLQSFNKGFEKGENKSFDAYNTLFSSMLSSAELYFLNSGLFKADKANKSGNLLKSAKDSILKILSKEKQGVGIETLLDTGSEQEAIGIKKETGLFDAFKNNPPNALKYFSEAGKFSVKKALKQLYTSFVNYGKKAYEKAEKETKKVVGAVKLTIYKLAKLGEYLMALTTPQWNMPYGSKGDLDCLAPEESFGSSVSEENKKYQMCYSFLKYTC